MDKQSPIKKVQTLYEHMQTTDFDVPMEDDVFRYITVPANDDERIIKFFRLGYEPAPAHAGNAADVVVLRHDKVKYNERYAAACEKLKGYVRDISPSTEQNKDVTVSSAVTGQERTLKELVDRLPSDNPDEGDDQ